MLALALPAAADPPGAWAGRMAAFRDWRLDCHADPCTVLTSVTGADGSEVLRLAVTDGLSLAVMTALPLYLPDGAVLGIGAEPGRAVAWRTCGAGGCEATVALDAALLAALKRERSGSATFTLVDGVTVRLPFSLLGFSAAMAARDAGAAGQAAKP